MPLPFHASMPPPLHFANSLLFHRLLFVQSVPSLRCHSPPFVRLPCRVNVRPPMLLFLPPSLPSRLCLPLLFLLFYAHFGDGFRRRWRDDSFINRTFKPRRYKLTLSIRNHNVTDVRFFRLIGVDNTADFYVAPGDTFTNTYTVNRKGAWVLFVEFPGNRYAKSQRKMISRDSFPQWMMEVYLFPPDNVGFSEWYKIRRTKKRKRTQRKPKMT
ncbi:hypothetical protein niasHT_039326 [Heterodera trifolii]|uniref:Uncharacterized protein n=1 Tax=Heterodera trifolii TaxID=157864 RepID=A0ABD2J248_9BILA